MRKLNIPLFFVIQLHLLNSPGSVGLFCWLGCCCCCEVLVAGGGSFLSRGEIKRRAKEIFWSNGVRESAVREESFEFCERDRDNDDKERDEVLFWRPIGYTFLKYLGKKFKFWLCCFCVSLTLLLLSRPYFLKFDLYIMKRKSKNKNKNKNDKKKKT